MELHVSTELLIAACVLTSSLLFVLYAGSRWAIKGDGYWPRGLLGVLLVVVLLLGPALFYFAFVNAVKVKQPLYWAIPPLSNTRSEP